MSNNFLKFWVSGRNSQGKMCWYFLTNAPVIWTPFSLGMSRAWSFLMQVKASEVLVPQGKSEYWTPLPLHACMFPACFMLQEAKALIFGIFSAYQGTKMEWIWREDPTLPLSCMRRGHGRGFKWLVYNLYMIVRRLKTRHHLLLLKVSRLRDHQTGFNEVYTLL